MENRRNRYAFSVRPKPYLAPASFSRQFSNHIIKFAPHDLVLVIYQNCGYNTAATQPPKFGP
jgi:hypothetical protein